MKLPRILPTLALFALAMLLPAAAQAPGAEGEIRAARAASNRAIAEGKIDGFSASLDRDFVMVRGSGMFNTREEYIAAFAEDFRDAKSVRYERFPEKVEVSAVAPLAAEHGHWVGHRPGGATLVEGTYLAMWRRGAEGWKLRSELFVLLDCKDAEFCAAYRKTAEPVESRN